jgi:putative ABC transport system permease protein
LARRYFGDQDAVGQIITVPHWGAKHNVAFRVIGEVAHVKHYGLDGSVAEKPQIYYSFYQLPDDAVPVFRDEVAFAVRTAADSGAVVPAIRKAVSEVANDQPVYNVATMRELVFGSMSRQRFLMILLTSFAGLALVLACVGIYGVISYSTARRVHEIGIRMALGAARRTILRMVLAEGLRIALIGVGSGMLTVLLLARALSGFSRLLYGVRVLDPATLSGAAVVLITAALAACYFPARRAARLDPMIALRHE